MILFGHSKIADEVAKIVPGCKLIVRGQELPWYADSFILMNGYLAPMTVKNMSDSEAIKHFQDNLWVSIRVCEHALELGPSRICVIGSSSAWRGSYNLLYAALKAGLHGYVCSRKLRPQQQLVCLAPGIIEDAGMTTRRTDCLDERRANHPHGRFTTCREVAEAAVGLLRGPIHINNTVIDMSGGER